MKTNALNARDDEQTMIEHERWTSAILGALHELRSASVTGLDRNGYLPSNDQLGTLDPSPLAVSVLPPPPKLSA